MNEYNFELIFKLPQRIEVDQYFKALESSCSDAIVGTGQAGYIAFDFSREAASAEQAVYSAIKDVRKAIEGVILIEASPDLVGVTDAANILGVSRQYMRKLLNDIKFKTADPVHQGATVIYHFSDILRCLQKGNKRNIEANLLDIAETNRKLNMYKQLLGAMSSSDEESLNYVGRVIPEKVRRILQNTP